MLALEDLAELGDKLRDAGFRIATHQYFDAQRVLLRLAAAGALPRELPPLEPYLAPVFCKSASEQQRFAQLYREWCQGLKPPPPPPGPPVPQPVQRRRRARRRAALLAAAVAVVIAAQLLFWQHYRPRTIEGVVTVQQGSAANIEVRLGNVYTRTDETGRFSFSHGVSTAQLPAMVEATVGERRGNAQAGAQFDAASRGFTATISTAISPALGKWLARLAAYSAVWSGTIHVEIALQKPTETRVEAPGRKEALRRLPGPVPAEERTAPTQRVSVGNLLLMLAPLLVFGVWAIGRLSRQPVLQRLASRTPAEIREIFLVGGIRALLPRLPLRRLAQELRRRRFVQSQEIQAEPTVAATLRHGGLFTAVRGSRAEPEYLALVDRTSLADHQAHLADQVLGELVRSDVLISRYDFDRSAGYCRPRAPLESAARERPDSRSAPAQAVALDVLRERHAEHRVLVFSDGAGCFDGFSGAPAPWLETLLQWPSPFLVTPMPPERWTRRERVLEQLGVTVLPLSQTGMLALMGMVGGTPSLERDQQPAVRGGQALHDIRPRQWLERRSPDAGTVARLCTGLQSELGERGFAWLAACAAYPEIHWGITLRLAKALVTDRVELEGLLPRLARLVWFREAFMPDWLRQALLSRLSVQDEAAVRRTLGEMLESVALKGSGDLPIRIALGQPVTDSPGRWRRLHEWWQRRRARKRAREMIETAPPDSPLRDLVFLQFINGERPIDLLSLRAPLTLLRTLAVRQQRVLPRAVTASVAAVSLSVLAAWTWPPVRSVPSILVLPDLKADARNVTVSGFSSGGAMAVQFHVAHSAAVSGAGVIAGAPYYCARGSLWVANGECMSGPVVASARDLAEVVRFGEESKTIDPAANLAKARVWLFHGKEDRTVSASVVQRLAEFYRYFGSSVAHVTDIPAGHAFVTAGSGGACSVTAPPFINDCDYDAAGELLRHLLGPLRAPARERTGRLAMFDQNAFAGGDAKAIGLADAGYVYIPAGCTAQQCRTHVVFHGCRQNAEAVGDLFANAAGYNRWADTNGLIVLYPQTVALTGLASGSVVFNPRACWDWWGYTGPQYHTSRGAQIRAVKAMVDRLAGSAVAATAPVPPKDGPVEVIRIGHVAPLTGGIAHLGKDNENGARLAIEEANAAKIQIGGRTARFEFISEDDQADPRVGVTVAQKLVDARVAGVVGHLNSGTSIPASPIYAQAGIPAVTPSATNPRLTEQGFRTAFRVVARDDQQGQALARYLVASQRPRLVAVIDDSTAYGEGVANEVERVLRASRIQVLPREKGTDRTTDWRNVIGKLRGRNPDAIIYGGMDATAGSFLRQAREAGLTARFLSGDGACTDTMSKLAGRNAEGMLCSQAGLPPELASRRFLDAYRKRFNADAILYAPFAYDAARVLIEAMRTANSSRPMDFLPALAKASYEGVTGKIEFDSKGDRRNAEVTIFTMKGERIVPFAVVRGERVLTVAEFGQLSRQEEALTGSKR